MGSNEKQAPLNQSESTDKKLHETQSVKHSKNETTENTTTILPKSIPPTNINAGNITAFKFISI